MKKKKTSFLLSEQTIRYLKLLPFPASTFIDIIVQTFFTKKRLEEIYEIYIEEGEDGLKRYFEKLFKKEKKEEEELKEDEGKRLKNSQEEPKEGRSQDTQRKKKSIDDMFEGFF
ncbi:MAG: hypothetical protein DSY32_02985 [Aquifex sp.]|nr:MAG: hypothetical protein DSY32_02985 [Aquifex sp.]